MSSERTISIRRTLSQTPLAERHEDVLRGAALRVPKPIPWQAFERDRYAPEALKLACDLYGRLAVGEYRAVGLFTQLTSGMALTAAPFDLVLASSRVSSDELRHADYCVRMASLCAGDEVTLEIEPEALEANVPGQLDHAGVDFLMLKYAAVGETLATALLTECRRRAKDPVVRALLTSLVGDEVHHARLGWYYASHRAPLWSRAEQQELADRIADFVLTIETEFWMGRDAPAGAEPAARALGVLDSETQRAVIRDVMEREIVPALDAVGLSGSAVWAIRTRGAPSA
jgi:hypothetical protein